MELLPDFPVDDTFEKYLTCSSSISLRICCAMLVVFRCSLRGVKSGLACYSSSSSGCIKRLLVLLNSELTPGYLHKLKAP